MLRPLVVSIVLVLVTGGAACVLNGQPTPPSDFKGGDATTSEDSGGMNPGLEDDASTNEVTSDARDAMLDAMPDGSDAGRDAIVDAQGDGG